MVPELRPTDIPLKLRRQLVELANGLLMGDAVLTAFQGVTEKPPDGEGEALGRQFNGENLAVFMYFPIEHGEFLLSSHFVD
ncbi:MAG: hypothetical protein QHC90_05525 [Shinella sp.]|nr:hypothetical protein [Shinella sp.]